MLPKLKYTKLGGKNREVIFKYKDGVILAIGKGERVARYIAPDGSVLDTESNWKRQFHVNELLYVVDGRFAGRFVRVYNSHPQKDVHQSIVPVAYNAKGNMAFLLSCNLIKVLDFDKMTLDNYFSSLDQLREMPQEIVDTHYWQKAKNLVDQRFDAEPDLDVLELIEEAAQFGFSRSKTMELYWIRLKRRAAKQRVDSKTLGELVLETF